MARELDVQLLEAAGDTVKLFVVSYRWDTEIVPDAALRAEADAIAAARDALR
jgi:hypothetical protein